MLSYKEQLFVSILNSVNLTEGYTSKNDSFLELLLEAPITDSAIDKIINDKKQVTIYYQGDSKAKKAWYPVQIISAINKGGKNFVKAYIVPKDGKKPAIYDFDQSKIVNWNVLGNAPANLAAKYLKRNASKKSSDAPEASVDPEKNNDVPIDPQNDREAEKAVANPSDANLSAVLEPDNKMEPEFEKKVVSLIKNDSIPKEKKKSLLTKLKSVGVFLSKAVLGAALVAGLAFGGGLKVKGVDHYIRKAYPNVAQLVSPTNLTNEDFTENQLKALGHVIYNAIQRGESPTKGSTEYKDYPGEYAQAIAKGGMLSNINFISKQMVSNSYMMTATTVGRFNYTQKKDGSYYINDKWDFSKAANIKTTAEDLEGLTYPEKISKIVKDNNSTFYSAIRHIAYLENPDDVPSFVAKRSILTIPEEYVVADPDNPPYDEKSSTTTKSSTKSNSSTKYPRTPENPPG
jgi:hypothetical protein